MKKISKLFLVLICVGLLLTTTVNAESVAEKWYTSSDTEKTKEVKKEALEKIAAAIPDTINVNVKEIDAVNGYDYDTELNDVGKYVNEQVNKAIKDAGISLPMEFEVTNDNGSKEKITVGEGGIVAGVFPMNMEWVGDELKVEPAKNLSTVIVELNVTDGNSSIVKTLKNINIIYTDSNKRNETDQKYVDNIVKEDTYTFYEVNEFDIINYGNGAGDEDYNKKGIEKISSLLREKLNDNTLEFKSFYPGEYGGMGDLEFGQATWILVVYKNGIAYKVIGVVTVSTNKITIPNTVPNTDKGVIDYINGLFDKSPALNIGKIISMEPIDDINDRFKGEGYNIPDNKGYYLFTFDDEDQSSFAFKLVRENPITSVKLNKSSLSLVTGKSEKLTATINPSDTTDSKTLTWTSSNTKVATVDANGNVKAIAAGTATITVKTSNGKTATVKVTVTNPNITITSVKINQNNSVVVINKTTKLTATINPSNTTSSKTLTWSSSNTKVATVDKNGTVKGIKAGTATITVKTSNGKTASVKVTVKKATPIKSVKLNKSSAKLELNKTLQLKATINPSGTTDDKTLTWTSSNKKVATVDKNGKVTAKAAGTAKITVKTSNGKKATVKITVSKINAKKAKIAAIANQTQTGKALKPTVTVLLNGKTLKSGTDYTVTYKNNKNAGKATVTVKFKGNYTGSVKSTFLIIPKKVAIKNPSTTKKAITVKYTKVSGAKTYQIAYRVKGTDKWSYTTKTKISKLTSGKEYEVMVRAGIKSGSKTLYGAWSDTKVIKVK